MASRWRVAATALGILAFLGLVGRRVDDEGRVDPRPAALSQRSLPVRNLSSTTLVAQTAVSWMLDTSAEVAAGRLAPDCSDLRVLYDTGAGLVELPHAVLLPPAVLTCAASNQTRIYFPLAAPLAANGSSASYVLQLGVAATDAGAPDVFGMAGRSVWACPFEGQTTCLAGGALQGAPPLAAPRSTAALGVAKGWSVPGVTLSDGTQSQTIEAWVRIDPVPYLTYWQSAMVMDSPGLTASGGCLTQYGLGLQFHSATELYPYFTVPGDFDGGCNESFDVTGLALDGGWHHLAGTFDALGRKLELFVDGVSQGTAAYGGTRITPYPTYFLRIGEALFGAIDEVRVSDGVRYVANFPPPRVALVPEQSTTLLLHLDEGGADPRAGGCLDVSPSRATVSCDLQPFEQSVSPQTPPQAASPLPRQALGARGSIFAEGPTTNLVPNPSFESSLGATSGWAVGSALTTAVRTDFRRFGAQSLEVGPAGDAGVPSGADHHLTATVSMAPGTPATLSAYVLRLYQPTGRLPHETMVRLVFGGSPVTGAGFISIGGGWTRVSFTGVSPGGPQSYGLELANGATVLVDGVQLEPGTGASTYCDGSLGLGYAWQGGAHQSASTRSQSYLYSTPPATLPLPRGTLALWVRVPPESQNLWANGEYVDLFDAFESGSTEDLRLRKADQGLSNELQLYIRVDGGLVQYSARAPQSFSPGEWHHLVATWQLTGSPGDFLRLFADGALVGSYSGPLPAPRLGPLGLANFELAELRVFDAALTTAEVQSLYAADLVLIGVGGDYDGGAGGGGGSDGGTGGGTGGGSGSDGGTGGGTGGGGGVYDGGMGGGGGSDGTDVPPGYFLVGCDCGHGVGLAPSLMLALALALRGAGRGRQRGAERLPSAPTGTTVRAA